MKYIPQMYNLNVKKNKLTEDDKKNIKEVADEIRKQFNIEEVIPSNYYAVVEKEGINVIALSHPNKNFFGASSYSADYGSFIFINSNNDITQERQIFSLFHELGHLLFNRNEYKQYDYDPLYKNNNNINDKIANQFAGYFLLPKDLVDDYIKARGKSINLYEMKNYFKVSIQTLYIALHDYGYISDEKYKGFWIEIEKNRLRKIEPKPIKPISLEDKNERLISAIKNLYLNEEISVNRIGEVLNVNLLDVRKIIKDWSVSIEQYERF